MNNTIRSMLKKESVILLTEMLLADIEVLAIKKYNKKGGKAEKNKIFLRTS